MRSPLYVLLSMVLITMLGVPRVQGQTTNAAAHTAVESWLSLIDQAQYAASWQTAASSFRNAISLQKWAEAAQTARGPLGTLKSRVMKSSTAAKTLPGAPDGDYVVMQFDSAFDKKAAALETITVVHDPDGQWRVVGYFIR